MARPKGPNQATLDKLIAALKYFPEGLWLRELSRQAGLSPSTTAWYIDHNPVHFEVRPVQSTGRVFMKFVYLRKGSGTKAAQKLQEILREDR